MSYSRVQLSKSIRKNQYLILFFSILFIIFILLMGSNLGFLAGGYDTDQKVYLLSGDVVKNFRFDSFDNKPISRSGQSQDRKMSFETNPVWRIAEDDIWLIDAYTIDDDVYIQYKVAMTNKINMFTSVELGDVVEPYPSFPDENNYQEIGYDDPMIFSYTTASTGLKKVKEEFLVANYRHSGLAGDKMMGWKSYLTWEHYNFGDVKDYNEKNNDFGGDVVMSFDIAQSPLPNFKTLTGNTLVKNFDYIAVSSIAVIGNTWGEMNDQIPEIVVLLPSEYDTTLNDKSSIDDFDVTAGNKWDASYRPNVELEVNTEPDSFDGRIHPQTENSSMNPRRKGGGSLFDPKEEQKSMIDVDFIYHIGSISPIVRSYSATLSYDYIYYETVDLPFWQIGTKRDEVRRYSHTRDVALHVTNRYIQSEIRVVFDIFTSYQIDVGADGIEDYDLDFPKEYYSLLTWITTVDGFGGGEQHTETAGLDWLFNPFGLDIGIIGIIIAIVVIIIVLFITLKFGASWYKARQTRKLIETALKRK